MADESDNMVLQMLRRIDAKVDRMADDLRDIKIRMTHAEEGLAGVNRLEMRFDRIERRLECSDAAL
jgi:hypothetical protein